MRKGTYDFAIGVSVLIFILVCITINAINGLSKNKIDDKGLTFSYQDIVGRSFPWNNVPSTITDYNSDTKQYTVSISPPNANNPIIVKVDRKEVMDRFYSTVNAQTQPKY